MTSEIPAVGTATSAMMVASSGPPATVPASVDELSIDQLTGQVQKIQQAMGAVMEEDIHYGVIPGTGSKPTLLKPGAEKLCLMFRLAPDYQVEETHDGDHYTVRVTCRLTHIPTGNFIASGEGLCTTKEAKYAYRKQARVCPTCGKDSIIKGRAEYGGGWLCFRKKGGCGAKFPDGAEVIESQPEGEIENDRLADTYNTVLKMGCKRALVAAVLNGTAASDLFTQDIEDFHASETPAATPPLTAQPGSSETYTHLLAELAVNAYEPSIWSQAAVLATANRHFARKIEALDQLTEDEMNSIIVSAERWRTENPPVVDVEAEEIPE